MSRRKTKRWTRENGLILIWDPGLGASNERIYWRKINTILNRSTHFHDTLQALQLSKSSVGKTISLLKSLIEASLSGVDEFFAKEFEARNFEMHSPFVNLAESLAVDKRSWPLLFKAYHELGRTILKSQTTLESIEAYYAGELTLDNMPKHVSLFYLRNLLYNTHVQIIWIATTIAFCATGRSFRDIRTTKRLLIELHCKERGLDLSDNGPAIQLRQKYEIARIVLRARYAEDEFTTLGAGKSDLKYINKELGEIRSRRRRTNP